MNFQLTIFNFEEANCFKKKSGGFSLIEIMIAMSLLALILGGITLFSVRTIQAHTRSQAMQNALDNARFAMESINKMVRTSQLDEATTINNPSASLVKFKSNSDGSEYKYEFTNDKLILSKDGESPVDLVGGGDITVDGHFETQKNSDDQRGFVATVITVTYKDSGSPSEKDSVTIRSGVSTRY